MKGINTASLWLRLAIGCRLNRRETLAAIAGSTMLVLASGAAHAEQQVFEPIADTTLYEDATSYGTGASDFLFVGPIASGSPRRSLLRFDLSALPPGATITAASLTFVVNRVGFSASLEDEGRLHRLQADWGEGSTSAGTGGGGDLASAADATWSHRYWGSPPGAPGPVWTTPGGDFVAAPSARFALDSFGAKVVPSNPALVADVAAWHATPASNHGWILLGPEGPEESQKARRLVSRSSAATSDRPRLTVTFEPAPPVTMTTHQLGFPLYAQALLAAVLMGVAARAGRTRRRDGQDTRQH